MSPRALTVLRWSLLALLGLVAAIAVGVGAAALTSRQIGLSSEPVRAGEALAPRSGGDGHRRRRDSDSAVIGPTTSTTSVPLTTTTEPTTTSDADDEDEDEDD